MNSADLIALIQADTRTLIESSFGELRTNLGTSHYHRLSNDELFRRGHAVYQHLSEWLATRDTAAVHRAGEELGRKRFSEGIPLGQVVLALILEEKYIWKYASQRNSQSEEKLRLEVAEFFARAIYSTALGYEESLAASNRSAEHAMVTLKPTEGTGSQQDSTQERRDMPISRGGQIGELGG